MIGTKSVGHIKESRKGSADTYGSGVAKSVLRWREKTKKRRPSSNRASGDQGQIPSITDQVTKKGEKPKLRRMQSFHQSVREGSKALHEKARRLRRTPRWLKILRKIYHQYGLKHVLLIAVLVLYLCLGAAIFYWIEADVEEAKEEEWKDKINENRTFFIAALIPAMFNNSNYLLFLSSEQTQTMYDMLESHLVSYEIQLGIKYGHQKIKWDFWNAMLYAGTICTTIGYGHLYPNTTGGRLLTMVYAIFGIPLVLSILDDLGKLLTKCMKYPWFMIKMGCRRMFRVCTKQTMEEIRRVDEEDRKDLEIFDLPIPVAIGIVILWIFVCSATFCIWEKEWDYFVAFYFFFISLSTIGLGDITPDQPKYLLMLFGYIIIGLSLVSMCINLIQAKLETTYQAGRDDLSEALDSRAYDSSRTQSPRRTAGDKNAKINTLGVLQRHSSHSLSSKLSSPSHRRKTSKFAQTLLSIPSPSKKARFTTFRQSLANGGLSNGPSRGKLIPTSLSIDDVMRLVDTEEDDVIILSELSHLCNLDQDRTPTVREIQANIEPEPIDPIEQLNFIDDSTSFTGLLAGAQGGIDLEDIEELEELEDQILLGTSDFGNKDDFAVYSPTDEGRRFPSVIHEEEEDRADDVSTPKYPPQTPHHRTMRRTRPLPSSLPVESAQGSSSWYATEPRKPSDARKSSSGRRGSSASGTPLSPDIAIVIDPSPATASGLMPSIEGATAVASATQEPQIVVCPSTPKTAGRRRNFRETAVHFRSRLFSLIPKSPSYRKDSTTSLESSTLLLQEKNRSLSLEGTKGRGSLLGETSEKKPGDDEFPGPSRRTMSVAKF